MRVPLSIGLGVLGAILLLTFYPLRRLAVTGFIKAVDELEHWSEGDED